MSVHNAAMRLRRQRYQLVVVLKTPDNGPLCFVRAALVNEAHLKLVEHVMARSEQPIISTKQDEVGLIPSDTRCVAQRTILQQMTNGPILLAADVAIVAEGVAYGFSLS